MDAGVESQIGIAIATLIVAVAGWVKSQANSKKLDQNTQLTSDIHKVTNGPMTASQDKIGQILTEIGTNAAVAVATAEAAKIQAATDAQKKEPK